MKTPTQESVGARLRSRRAVMVAAGSALGALGLGALAQPEVVLGGTHPPLLLNQDNPATGTTELSSGQTHVFLGTYDTAVWGATYAAVDYGVGVYGSAVGTHGISVKGVTIGLPSQIGVLGDVTSSAQGDGIAVKGQAGNGIGIWAEATGGHALHVVGRAVFANRSGKTTFSTGQGSRTVTNQYVGGEVMVLATIQGNVAGTWVRGVSLDVAKKRFTIRLNKAAPSQLVVGWFIVN